jgi:hypothetical protein
LEMKRRKEEREGGREGKRNGRRERQVYLNN